MKKTKTKKATRIGELPTFEDLYEVMEAICSVPNPWSFCLRWATEKPRLFNKFMDMCAWFTNDESFVKSKVEDTDFMHHKRLKKDVLVSHKSKDGYVFWDPITHMWNLTCSRSCVQPKEKH